MPAASVAVSGLVTGVESRVSVGVTWGVEAVHSMLVGVPYVTVFEGEAVRVSVGVALFLVSQRVAVDGRWSASPGFTAVTL